MKNTIFDYYGKNHRETLLFFITVGLIILMIPRFYTPKKSTLSEDKIAEFYHLIHYRDSLLNRWKTLPIAINDISLDSLIAIGLNPRLAKSIDRYRGFGKKIRHRDHMLRVYGMTDSILLLMNIDYSMVPLPKNDSINQHENKIKLNSKPRWQSEEVFINQIPLDSLIAYQFPPKLSKTLIKYRTAIGGFKNEDDLKKIYGFKNYHLRHMDLNFSPRIKQSVPADDQKILTQPKWQAVEIMINEIELDSLVSLGFPSKLSNTIIKYRNAIGHYASQDDLKKVYGITDDYLKHLNINYKPSDQVKKDTTLFASSLQRTNQKSRDSSSFKKYKNYKPIVILDINLATREQLIAIYNIGPASADRILEYREKLGGFYTLEQVGKIKNLHPDGFKAIKENTQIQAPHNKLNLYQNNAASLSIHPYITESQAKKIVEWVSTNPNFDLSDLKKSYIFSDLEWTRISPYF